MRCIRSHRLKVQYMLAVKIFLYVATLAGGFYFAFRERKLRQQLTDDALRHRRETASDFDSLYEIRKEIAREQLLRDLPPTLRSSLNYSIGFKFLFIATFLFEIFILQR